MRALSRPARSSGFLWWCRVSCPWMSVDILGTNCDQSLSMVQCCFTSTETVRLIRTESPGWPPWLSHSSRTLWIPTCSPLIYIPAQCGAQGPQRALLRCTYIHTSVRGWQENHTHLHSKLGREGSNALLVQLAVLEEGVAVVKCSMLNSTDCVQEAPHAWLPWKRQWPVCSTLSILNMTCTNGPAHPSYISEFKEYQLSLIHISEPTRPP